MPQIDTETLAILDQLSVLNDSVAIVTQLDRKLYTKVNKVLEACGGKWDRRRKAHVFPEDPREVLDQVILTGEYRREKQELGVFYTPEAIARKAVAACGNVAGQFWLEPQAGMGGLAKPLRAAGANVTCADILSKHTEELDAQGFQTWTCDFLETDPTTVLDFDGVLMNPPFGKQADAEHFLHARKFVRPGGLVVAIMPASVTFRETGRYRTIRDAVKQNGGTIEPLPSGAFKESGTMVNTCLVVLPVR